MVTIRLSRGGAKKRPYYHVVVADERRKRDGRYIERIGFFNPVAVGGEVKLRVDRGRADYWMSQGAKPTERVSKLLKEAATQAEAVPAPTETESVRAEAKPVAAAPAETPAASEEAKPAEAAPAETSAASEEAKPAETPAES